MGIIRIEKIDITYADFDAIVNAANEGLRPGGGVCGAIFEEAGRRDLQVALRKLNATDHRRPQYAQ